jgi:hypothetical protein
VISTRDDAPRLPKIDIVESLALSGVERVDDTIKRLAGSPNFTAGVAEILSVTREAGDAIGNGADGISDIEGKVARVAMRELGNERVSNRGSRHRRGGEGGAAEGELRCREEVFDLPDVVARSRAVRGCAGSGHGHGATGMSDMVGKAAR